MIKKIKSYLCIFAKKGGNMKLLIENLGPIKNNKQTIDLSKNFYVFVGENNSGKTYVSQLLWTVFNPDVIYRFAEQIELENIDFENLKEFELTKDFIDDILNKFAAFLKVELATTYNIQNTKYKHTVLKDLSLSFYYDIKEVRKKLLKVRVPIFMPNSETQEEIELFRLNKEEESLQMVFLDKKPEDYSFEKLGKNVVRFMSRKISLKKISFVSSIIHLLLFKTKQGNSFFLPTSRAFYPSFYQYIYAFERGKNIQRPYTNPHNEVIEKIFALNTEKPKSQEEYQSLLNQLTQLMGGEIALSSLEGIGMLDFEFKMKNSEEHLPMYLASSSINQLTLLYLFFKYWAEKEGNFLLIDEPEENLNPKNQIKLLEILIEFANQNNNKVLINTHSNILAESLNNYIYLDALKNDYEADVKNIIKENNLQFLNPDISMADEKVGAYFFNGNRIIDYQQENEDGIYFRDFVEVSYAVEKNGRILTDYIYLKDEEEDEQAK